MTQTVKQLVTDRLGAIGPVVQSKVVDLLVDQEVERRVKAVSVLVAKLDELNGNLKKIDRADVETFNQDGSPATATFTKARLEEIKKAKEQIAKIEKALDMAFENNDFQKVFDLAK
jgi:hypothetical protein